jgi:hypothetical protein
LQVDDQAVELSLWDTAGELTVTTDADFAGQEEFDRLRLSRAS